eukprot:212953_1
MSLFSGPSPVAGFNGPSKTAISSVADVRLLLSRDQPSVACTKIVELSRNCIRQKELASVLALSIPDICTSIFSYDRPFCPWILYLEPRQVQSLLSFDHQSLIVNLLEVSPPKKDLKFPNELLPRHTQLLLKRQSWDKLPPEIANRYNPGAGCMKLNAKEYFMARFCQFFAAQPKNLMKNMLPKMDTSFTNPFDYISPRNATPLRHPALGGLVKSALNFFMPVEGKKILGSHPLSSFFFTFCLEFWLNQNAMELGEYLLPPPKLLDAIRQLIQCIQQKFSSVGAKALNNTIRLYFYKFFSVSFKRFPLDHIMKFPGIARLWIRYLKPWAVDGSKRKNRDRRPEYSDEWGWFVENNLIFYSVLMTDFIELAQNLDFRESNAIKTLMDAMSVYTSPVVQCVECCNMCVFQREEEEEGEFGGMQMTPVDDQLLLLKDLGDTYRWFKQQPSGDYHTYSVLPIVEDMLKQLEMAAKGASGSFFSSQPKSSSSVTSDMYKQLSADLKRVFCLSGSGEYLGMNKARVAEDAAPLERDYRGYLTPKSRQDVISGRRFCRGYDVPVIGSQWDRPPASYEPRPLVYLLTKLSEWLSAQTGVDISLRALADMRIWVLLFLFGAVLQVLYGWAKTIGGFFLGFIW